MDEDIISPRPDPPPLRIHHLMACAVVAAVMFSFWRNISPQINTLGGAQAAIMAIWGGLTSIAVTFAIFSIYWHARGYAGLTQPGQWLLIGFAVAVIRSTSWTLFVTTVPASNNFSLPYRVFTALAFSSIVPLVFYLWCAWKVADTSKWRIAFVAISLVPIVCGAWVFFYLWGVSNTGIQNTIAASNISQNVIRAIAVGIAALSDRSAMVRRYWIHWLGVGLFILVCVSSIVGSAVSWLYS